MQYAGFVKTWYYRSDIIYWPRKMTVTLGFDVYGTLIDTHGVVDHLESLIGDQAIAFSNTWREKQLEYTFRRGLMGKYRNFPICTRDALEYTCSVYKTAISDQQKQNLLAGYLTLPSFADVSQGLAELQAAGFQMYAFSNGINDALDRLLTNAGIRDFFLGLVSVDDVRTFKPSPEVYQHFLKVTGSTADNAWLISSNPFDVIGAISQDMNAAWVQRASTSIFDPWGIEPTVTVNSLSGLDKIISNSLRQAD